MRWRRRESAAAAADALTHTGTENRMQPSALAAKREFLKASCNIIDSSLDLLAECTLSAPFEYNTHYIIQSMRAATFLAPVKIIPLPRLY